MDKIYQPITIRKASLADYHVISAFMNLEPQVHRHLDWRSGLDWLGYQPFLIAERDGDIVGVMACPPDPPETAWVRLFCAPNNLQRKYIWRSLLERAIASLEGNPPPTLAAISLQSWFDALLKGSGFRIKQQIVVLEWMGKLPAGITVPQTIHLRHMVEEDLPQVVKVDAAAFAPIWRNSLESLRLAFHQSAHSTVIEDERGIVAYQISTAISINGHLARLAVLPEVQNRHYGYALIRDLLVHFSRINAWRVTVNTQADNQASLSLYTKAGFSRTGETFDVYSYDPH